MVSLLENKEKSLADEVAKPRKLQQREHRSDQKSINAETKFLAALKRQEQKQIKVAAAAAKKREQEESKADHKRCREALDAQKAAKRLKLAVAASLWGSEQWQLQVSWIYRDLTNSECGELRPKLLPLVDVGPVLPSYSKFIELFLRLQFDSNGSIFIFQVHSPSVWQSLIAYRTI